MRRWTLLALGLALSVAITVALWAAGLPGFFLFLAVPFLFFPMGRRSRRSSAASSGSRACAACGTARVGDHRFCPSCGSRFG